MRIRVIAVGTKMPAWVDTAASDYSARLPAELALEWREVRAEPRSASGSPAVWMQREADRIRSAIMPGAWRVVLDERGRDQTTRQFAQRVGAWRDRGAPVALVIGGPDGIDPALRDEADELVRLSSLTLPHPLVRVVLAEQLFRAWSILTGHPYHRD
ncbi:MAG: 23S rRNA (pseudouridine(1915)-N(3))-methyltransferase RlmH [Betaproteobacteria bacterium]|nr:23S rRNA (pseudouridine(1915)-N(3))-methyltransferase RlmH [Betaproteobacteria bacterium]